ncbi:MAG: NAD(P)(+) transhydrogenase (Re/Si-specific) subunit beta [Acidobacteriota bacterium]|nr:NAD(P)(+) transhydrogenase (Re/Si-specific) subunit beta [Acidobacteriota bacterium]
MNTIVALLYLIASILFIMGLKMLTKVKTARRGNMLSSSAMFLAVVATLLDMGTVDYRWIIAGMVLGGLVGSILALKVKMTAMPEMVAIFNGFGGGASALVASSLVFAVGFQFSTVDNTVTTFLSILIGGVTFTGSLIAFGKLNGTVSGQPILFPGQHLLNAILLLGAIALIVLTVTGAESGSGLTAELPVVGSARTAVIAVVAIALLLGVLLVIPIGGADMPVVISLLNSYSGIAAAAAGFVLTNNVLIISGALVGASGLILTQIMCKAMNRSLANVLFGGFGAEPAAGGGGKGGDAYPNVKSCGAEEAAMILEGAHEVIVVPGYGLAVAQAQHVTKEFADALIKRGARVRYAIHPVAGRMPGHMNVLLAESNVPHEQLKDLDDINEDFKNADVSIVLGANDVVNPAAITENDSPIYGMPVLKVWEAKTSFVIKRSLSPGFAAIPNDLFNYDNNLMLFGDAKKIMGDLVKEIKELD